MKGGVGVKLTPPEKTTFKKPSLNRVNWGSKNKKDLQMVQLISEEKMMENVRGGNDF